MKKETRKKMGDDLRREYDFRGGVRGKYYQAMQAGYTIIVHKADGSTVVKKVKPSKGAIILEPELRPYFPDSDSVNATLRSLVRLVRIERKALAKNHHTQPPKKLSAKRR